MIDHEDKEESTSAPLGPPGIRKSNKAPPPPPPSSSSSKVNLKKKLPPPPVSKEAPAPPSTSALVTSKKKKVVSKKKVASETIKKENPMPAPKGKMPLPPPNLPPPESAKKRGALPPPSKPPPGPSSSKTLSSMKSKAKAKPNVKTKTIKTKSTLKPKRVTNLPPGMAPINEGSSPPGMGKDSVTFDSSARLNESNYGYAKTKSIKHPRRKTQMDFYTSRSSSPLGGVAASSVITSLTYEHKETTIQKKARKCFNRAHYVVLDEKKAGVKAGELSGLKMTSLRALFAYHDEDDDGYINKHQLRTLIQCLGFIPSDAVINGFVRTFPGKKGQEWTIKMNDFLKGSASLNEAGDAQDTLMELFTPFLNDNQKIPKNRLIRLLNGTGLSRLGAKETKDFIKGLGYYNKWQDLDDGIDPVELIDKLIFEF